MHRFEYRNGSLYCENTKVVDIVKSSGTPLYVYSKNTFLDHYGKLREALSEVSPLICFSVKSNSNLSVLKTLVTAGAGLDIVSGGELYRAKLIKADPKKIVYAGVGKKEDEIRDAINYGILFFNIESPEELALIDKCAKRIGKKVNVAIRINPDIDAHTHAYITTGKAGTKFGVDFATARKIIKMNWKYRNAQIRGLHLHIGSQILSIKPFTSAIKKTLDFLEKNRIYIEYINIGGGMGIIYSFEKAKTAESFAKKIVPLIKKAKLKLILEPGRFISGNSGIFVTKVLFRKKTGKKNFVIVDGGMNDLIRPSLYEAYHEILPIEKKDRKQKKIRCSIVGPICESGDFLAKDRLMPYPEKGEYLAVMSAGAYGYAMSSNYNSRPRVAEVMVDNNRFFTIKTRENYRDLVRGESAKI